MKFLVILLLILGFIGPVFAQSMEGISDKIWLPNCPIGTSTECDQSSLFPDAIALPFYQSDSVAIGTIVEKDSQNQNSIRYSLDVDFFLKNYQPFDLLTATLFNATEPEKFPDVLYYNSPIFNEGDLVFVYLKKSDGQFNVLPESFALDKHEVRGPPPDIHFTKSPSEKVFQQGEKILVSGEVRKLELIKAVKQGTQLEVKLMVKDSDDRDNMIFSDLMKIESDGNYNYFFDSSKIPPGKFELEVNYGPSTSGTEITIEPNFQIWTPIKQHNFGIAYEDILCRENLVLVQKYDGSPACVKPMSINKMIERGCVNKEFRTLPIQDLQSQERIFREAMYLGVMMLLPHVEEEQTIAISLEGRTNIISGMIQQYDIDILSNKTSEGESSSNIFGKITKKDLQKFFEDEPMNSFTKRGVLLISLGGYKDNTGTYGPYNQFLSEQEGRQIGEILQYYQDKRSNQEMIEWRDFVEWPTGKINQSVFQKSKLLDIEQLCITHSGTWNKDFASCFDFSDEFDCLGLGGILDEKAYTSGNPDYTKISDSYVCLFKK